MAQNCFNTLPEIMSSLAILGWHPSVSTWGFSFTRTTILHVRMLIKSHIPQYIATYVVVDLNPAISIEALVGQVVRPTFFVLLASTKNFKITTYFLNSSAFRVGSRYLPKQSYWSR